MIGSNSPNRNGKNQKDEKKRHKNKFLVNEEKRRREEEKKKSDKHLFPITRFFDKDGGLLENVQLPYAKLDMIFNAKNLWANFQNPDPASIKYNLHRTKQWRPLVFIEDEEEKKEEKKKTKNQDDDSSSNGMDLIYLAYFVYVYTYRFTR